MAQIQKGDSFEDGELVTAGRLNQLLDSAIINPELIGDQAYIGVKNVSGSDEAILKQSGTGLLKRATITDVLNSGLAITTDAISSYNATAFTIYSWNSGIDVSANKYFKVQASDGSTNAGKGIELISDYMGGDIKLSATDNSIILNADDVSIVPYTSFSATSAVKIPVGTTLERPTTPAIGDFRYNTTLGYTEVYSSAGWGAVSFQPKVYVKTGNVSPVTGSEFNVYSSPSLTIPADETWVYEINVSTNSGYVTGSTRPDVNAIRFRVYNNSTQIWEQYGSCSPYGAHTGNWMYTRSMTSADNGFILNAKVLSVVALDTPVNYRVTLTKIKTANISDASSCI